MKLVNTLPFRPDISNFLRTKTIKKAVTLVLFSCFIQLTSSCSKLTEVESLDVEIWHNGSPLICNAFESGKQVWSIQQLAFFISDVTLSGDNVEQNVQLTPTPWQTNDLVLIQPYLADCAKQNEGAGETDKDDLTTLENNNHLQFLLPVDIETSEQLSFTLAVPFLLNHQNPLQQPSPLNVPNMFWSWRSGHKFFRLDMQGPNNNWVFHLGSVGCSAVSTMRAPKNECVQPNRVSFMLDKKGDGTKLILHLDRIIANTSIQNNGSCLFHSGQESCSVLMSNLKNNDVFEWL